MKSLSLALAGWLCFAGASAALAQSSNLLSNPGFEGAVDRGTPAGWQSEGKLQRDLLTTLDSVGGMHALELGPGAHGGAVFQPVTLQPGEYTLRAFLQVEQGDAELYLDCGEAGASQAVAHRIGSNEDPAGWRVVRVPVLTIAKAAQCKAGVGTAGDAKAHVRADNFVLRATKNFLSNGDFKSGLAGWTMQPSAAATLQAGGTVELAAAGDAQLTQTVNPLPKGYFSFSAEIQSTGGQRLARLEATNCGEPARYLNLPMTQGQEFRRVVIRGITATAEQCTVGVHVVNEAGQSVAIRNLRLEPGNVYNMIAGGDVSLTDMVEEHGGVYKLDGAAQDPFKIMRGSGMTLARLRLFVDPGNPQYAPSKKMQGRYDDLTHMLVLAKRAHAAGMQIEVAMHLSDVWADPSCQAIPHAWLGQDADHLVSTVSAYVTDVVTKMVQQGTPPDGVAIGNETDNGMLVSDKCAGAWIPVGANRDNPDLLARIYVAGYKAVKAASPTTQVLWHLADNGKYAQNRKYLDAMFARHVPVDVLAFSAYPFWASKTVQQFQDFASYVAARYGKPVFFEETGYPWASAAGADNMTNGGPEPYPLTLRGQMDFLNDEIAAIESADDGMLIGFSWWDASWIPAPGTFDNVDNYVLFDREGNALPALTRGYGLRGK